MDLAGLITALGYKIQNWIFPVSFNLCFVDSLRNYNATA